MKEIYLVHDNQDSPGSRLLFLENAGYQVTLFERSEQCLRAIGSSPPALAILDTLLLGLNGFELCRRIRAEHAVRSLPIIICSGLYRSSVFMNEAIDCGAQRYILAPYELDELLTQVNFLTGTCLDQKRDTDPQAA